MRKSLPALLAGTLIAQTIVLTIANDLPISGTNSIFLIRHDRSGACDIDLWVTSFRSARAAIGTMAAPAWRSIRMLAPASGSDGHPVSLV